MAVRMARKVGPEKIDIAYECFGNAASAPLLLIMGIGAQMIAWNEGFISQLVDKGFYVIRFDNRDVGLSTHFHKSTTPDLPATLAGDLSSASYTLSNMAADAIGLLDILGIDFIHLVGASMGGFIAQTISIEYPSRVLSLTSIMSTTGAPSVGQLDPIAMSIFLLPPPTNRLEAMNNAIAALKVIGSPSFPFDETDSRERAGLAFDRCYDPVGIARQAVASVASGDRTEKLKSLEVPTLVIHGEEDKMCDISGGEATANAIPNARLVRIEGMGHNLPRQLWPRISSLIAEHIESALE